MLKCNCQFWCLYCDTIQDMELKINSVGVKVTVSVEDRNAAGLADQEPYDRPVWSQTSAVNIAGKESFGWNGRRGGP